MFVTLAGLPVTAMVPGMLLVMVTKVIVAVEKGLVMVEEVMVVVVDRMMLMVSVIRMVKVLVVAITWRS